MESGLHLEGPFINKEKKGAHLVECIESFKDGMADILRVYGDLGNTAIVTLAPELPGALDAVDKLTGMGIIVSVGKGLLSFDVGLALNVCRHHRG